MGKTLSNALAKPQRKARSSAPRGAADRAAGASVAARRPSQERSRKRVEAIIEAAETLLETANIEDVSFYDIARQAEISPPSVFYLFPSMAAVQAELRRRHNEKLSGLIFNVHDKLARMRVPTWQEWIRVEASEGRAYYQANRPACEALLGPLLRRENRATTLKGNALTGASQLANMRRIFVVPDLSGLDEKFGNSCEILEMFWGGAYMARGIIDDETFEESLRASIGYLRNYLPETLAMRPDFADAAGDIGG